MKIEMGESLFYSWLRHVKECQVVQTNWKVSAQWDLKHSDELENLMQTVDSHYREKHDYCVFKKNTSLSQLILQGECDVLGMNIRNGETVTYAVDVAFHEAGLNYGSKDETIMKVIEKSARTAFCIYGFLDTKDAEIIFASPKINPAVLNSLEPCMEELHSIFHREGFNFKFRVIANEDYNELVLKPILLVSDGVSDTSELFLRSYQMFKMFAGETELRRKRSTPVTRAAETVQQAADIDSSDFDAFSELKVGQLAKNVLAKMLMDGCASDEEIRLMQTADYSKRVFDIQYPLLLKYNDSGTVRHYYASSIKIAGDQYRLCCEWFEQAGGNNDRPYLLKWIALHQK